MKIHFHEVAQSNVNTETLKCFQHSRNTLKSMNFKKLSPNGINCFIYSPSSSLIIVSEGKKMRSNQITLNWLTLLHRNKKVLLCGYNKNNESPKSQKKSGIPAYLDRLFGFLCNSSLLRLFQCFIMIWSRNITKEDQQV